MIFKKISKFKTKNQILLAVIIVFSVICVWRGFWGLMDIYLLPHNYELSLWVSLILGLIILISSHFAVKELM